MRQHSYISAKPGMLMQPPLSSLVFFANLHRPKTIHLSPLLSLAALISNHYYPISLFLLLLSSRKQKKKNSSIMFITFSVPLPPEPWQ